MYLGLPPWLSTVDTRQSLWSLRSYVTIMHIILTIRSQHSQECKNACQPRFC